MFDFFGTKEICKDYDGNYYAVDIMGNKHKATEYSVMRTGYKGFIYHIYNDLKHYVVHVHTKDDVVCWEVITEEED